MRDNHPGSDPTQARDDQHVSASAHPNRRSVLDYQALMECSVDAEWLPLARSQLESWLRDRKALDVDTSVDGSHESVDRRLDVTHHHDRNSKSMLARLVEAETPTGTWTTEFIAHDRRGTQNWLSLTVRNDQGRFVDVPALATRLLDTLPVRDGELHLLAEPQVYGSARVDELIDILCDEERHGLLFVAVADTTGGVPFDGFVRQVGSWTRQVRGLAQVVVLDPAAAPLLVDAIGAAYAVQVGTIRTYLPGVDPASSVDMRRHRYLGRTRLSQMSDGAVRYHLGRVARSHAETRPERVDVQRVHRLFARLANQAIVQAIEVTSTPAPKAEPAYTADFHPLRRRSDREPLSEARLSDELEGYLAQVNLVKAVLGIEVLEEETLGEIAANASAPRTDPAAVLRAAEQLRAQQKRIEALEDEVRLNAELADDDQEQQAAFQQEFERLTSENRWLRERLNVVGDHAGAYGATPEDYRTEYPENFGELLDRLKAGDIEGVRFTGDRAEAEEVDEHDTLQGLVRIAWDACNALGDYIRAKRQGDCDKGVDHYLKHPPAGYRTFPPGKHAPTETGTTMRSYGRERLFCVPPASLARRRDCHESSLQARPCRYGEPAHVLLRRHGTDWDRLHRLHRPASHEHPDVMME